MSTYGTPAGVAVYVRHMLNGAATFDSSTKPPIAHVEQWLVERSAQLTACLAAAGYAVPVTQPEAKSVLDRYANIGAAGDCELSMRNSGYSADDENAREIKFLAEFDKACPWIQSGALTGLGVPQAAEQARSGIAVGRLTAGSDYIVR